MQFDGFGLGRMTGRATFVGPTGMFRITEKLSVNAVFLSQIAGRARGVPAVRLDLDNFERRIYRVALSAAF